MTDITRVDAELWAGFESHELQIIAESADILSNNEEVKLWLDAYVGAVISPNYAEITTPPPTEVACERLFGEGGVLATNGLRMVVTASDRLRMYGRTEVPYLYTPEGVDYWGGFMLDIEGSIKGRQDGKPGNQFLITPRGTILEASQLGRDILTNTVNVIAARKELADKLDDMPVRKSPESTMDGTCGSCTQFNCRHGRYNWMYSEQL